MATMRSTQTDQNGFGAVGILLIILVLVIIGGAGWLVWQRQHKATPTPVASTTTTTTTTTKASPTPAPDPTAGWTKYSDANGQFSLRYPTTWVKASNADQCSAGLLLLGPNASSVGHCASESVGEVEISSTDGDHRTDYKMVSGSGYGTVTTEAVTVSGVAGTKSSGTTTAPADEMALGPVAGTKVVRYVFFTNGKTYLAAYNQAPTYPDVLSDFNLLVGNTLKFAP